MKKLLKTLKDDEKLIELIISETEKVIYKIENKKYLTSFIKYFEKEYGNSDCDKIEIFVMEKPSIISIKTENNKIIIKVNSFWGWYIWNRGEKLGKVTMTIYGIYSCYLINDKQVEINIEKDELQYCKIDKFKIEYLNCLSQCFDKCL